VSRYSAPERLNNEIDQYENVFHTVSALETWRLGCKLEAGG